jgi:hypothetical protein
MLMVDMGARGSGIHDIYFPGARGLGIHEVVSSWHVTFSKLIPDTHISMRYNNIFNGFTEIRNPPILALHKL